MRPTLSLFVAAALSPIAAFEFTRSRLSRSFGTHRNSQSNSCQSVLSVPCASQHRHCPPLLFMTKEQDEDEEIDPNSLGDWRTFRMNLVTASSSIGVTPDVTSIDGITLEDEETSSSSNSGKISMKSATVSRPKSVSKRNEEILMAQNELLGEEYLKGAWAHESAVPEVGGLVCRMPLEAELNNPSSILYKRLQSFLESENYRSTNKKSSASLSPLAAKTAFWYRGAEQLLKNDLEDISMMANENGKIEVEKLGRTSLELLQLYIDYQQTWQHVCLVVEKDDLVGTAKTIAINRPMAFKLSESLGRLVLLGAFLATGGVEKRERTGVETQLLVKFLAAFENECGVYVGGPHKMEEPATMIHGISDLPGAVEISPGTGIFMGGVEAACDGVLSGKYKPLDFRFFIGHTSYEGGELDRTVELGKYQPIACSRPLVLKQCIQLPKPLWHEGAYT
ncbi:hypothetical protein HJC23_002263 [Cyclotella cryptica]|uniref:Uncharacterized protein n=1 Tax=Cyclotella cryptica TaxID=29204 RepID=A0ABD3QFX1_9STRA